MGLCGFRGGSEFGIWRVKRIAKEVCVDKPVRLSSDEFDTIVGVANYALKRLGRPSLLKAVPADGVLRSVLEVIRYDAINPLGFLPFRRLISRDDLEFLAPYIDEWISGRAPPQNLPAEYPDERPERLRALKERMQKEGFWPDGPVSP
jgi:hypothetical protein